MSKQLLIGLVLGALGAGLVFMMAGTSSPRLEESSDGLPLLAQVIPNEPLPIPPISDEDVIEVRSASPASPSAKARAVAEVRPSAEAMGEEVDEAEAEEAEAENEAVFAWCEYENNDKPKREAILSEVAWMGSWDDANAEWVEIQNRIKGELDVSGWQLIDKAGQIRVAVPDETLLERSGFLVFERDEKRLPGQPIIYKGALGNADEGLRLFDDACELQDEVIAKSKWPAGTNKPKATAERGRDLSWHTFYGDDDAGLMGTPWRRNSSGPPPEPEPEPEPEEEVNTEPEELSEPEPVASSTEPEPQPGPIVVQSGQLIISEVMAGTASSAGDEFIELLNTAGDELDLTGFSIKKKVLSSGSENSLVTTVNFEGKKVAPGQRFIIGHGSFASQSQMTWPTSYSIAYTGNAVLLYNAQGEKIDEVSWELSAGQSYACASQGSCAVQETPNPGN